ncbi:MAG TPA: DUF2079 domain-containing protein [Pseudonocardiaceae bacterium]|nr:DUF2079 domain-containing protein [Pseudonocardiaceae bacterium]
MLELTDVHPDVTTVVAPRRRHLITVTVLTAAAAALYATVEFLRYYTFRAGTYDLVIFDQAVRSYSHFHLPVAIVSGVHRGFGTGFSELGDHFSPILATLAPLYWVHSGPQTLLAAQAVLFAAAIPPLWRCTRRELGTFAAYCVAVGYAISWPVAQAVAFDVHEVAFVPVLMAVLFERFGAYRRDRGRWWHLVLPALGLLAVKEDMGLMVAAFGLAVLIMTIRWVTPRRAETRRLGAGLVVGGLVAVVVCTDIVLPAFGSKPRFYWRYGEFGPSLPGAVWDMLTHPATVGDTFVQPQVKVQTTVALFTLAAFASLLSPFLLVVLPQLAERMLSDAPNWWSTAFHYDAFLVVPLLCAGVDAVARVRRWSARGRPVVRLAGARLGVLWVVAVLVIAVSTVHDFAFDQLLHGSSWQRTAAVRAEAGAVARVPSGVTVEAANPLGPRLTSRTTVVLWDELPRWAPWVVADTANQVFPFCSVAAQQARVDYLTGHGYRIVYSVAGYVVLHHPGPVPPLVTAQSPGC